MFVNTPPNDCVLVSPMMGTIKVAIGGPDFNVAMNPCPRVGQVANEAPTNCCPKAPPRKGI